MESSFSEKLPDLLKKTKSGQNMLHSLKRHGIPPLFAALLYIAQSERNFTGDDLTSHDCAALFQGKKFANGNWGEANPLLQFHPMDRPELAIYYSSKMPDHMISYTWANFGLIKHLPLFLNTYETLVPESASEESTFWLDVVFNDQNSPNMTLYLDIAELLYSGARYHLALLFGGMLSRAWCAAEIKARFLSALKALGLLPEGKDKSAAVIKGGEHIRNGNRAFTTFVAVQDITNLDSDVCGNYDVDRYAKLSAFEEDDLRIIKESILEAFGCKEAFNFYMAVIRNAVLCRHAELNTVRRARPSCHESFTPPTAIRLSS